MPSAVVVGIRKGSGLVVAVGLAVAVVGPGACTDGSGAVVQTQPQPHVSPQEPRNSDGSLQRLPPGPPSRPPYTLVLDYYDFGPQAMAAALIGMSWWQWEAGGSWEIDDRFDVRVVVHRGITTQEVMAEYPTVKGQADYRYVSYDDAMAFFDEHIAEIEGEPSLERLQAELRATQARVRQSLGGGAERGVGP
jgi:hypothetical protein